MGCLPVVMSGGRWSGRSVARRSRLNGSHLGGRGCYRLAKRRQDTGCRRGHCIRAKRPHDGIRSHVPCTADIKLANTILVDFQILLMARSWSKRRTCRRHGKRYSSMSSVISAGLGEGLGFNSNSIICESNCDPFSLYIVSCSK